MRRRGGKFWDLPFIAGVLLKITQAVEPEGEKGPEGKDQIH